jgi:sulfite exporter TauE/SafE
MCGGIAGALGLATGEARDGGRLPRSLLYSLGRIGSYGLLGASLGALGQATHALLGFGHSLRMVAGLLIVLFGFQLMGLPLGGHRLERLGLSIWRRLQPLGARVGKLGTLRGALLTGAFWGFLPCGLVYSAAAAATATGSAAAGAIFMLAFGLGTLPALLLASSTASGMGALLRNRSARRLAGALMVVFGCWSVWGGRGLEHVGAGHVSTSVAASDRHASRPLDRGVGSEPTPRTSDEFRTCTRPSP